MGKRLAALSVNMPLDGCIGMHYTSGTYNCGHISQAICYFRVHSWKSFAISVLSLDILHDEDFKIPRSMYEYYNILHITEHLILKSFLIHILKIF